MIFVYVNYNTLLYFSMYSENKEVNNHSKSKGDDNATAFVDQCF